MQTAYRILQRLLLTTTLLAAASVISQQDATPPPKPAPLANIKVYLAGDSTMANKEVIAYPETGWGMPFAFFFDRSVTVDNRAKNGRSTRTFISEGLWQSILDSLKPGDYVFIQFGHNDEVKEKVDRYTTPDEY